MSTSPFPAWAMRRARNQCWIHPNSGRLSLIGSFFASLFLSLLVFPISLGFLLLCQFGTIAPQATGDPHLAHRLLRLWSFDLPQDRLEALILIGQNRTSAATLAYEIPTDVASIHGEIWKAMVARFALQAGINPASTNPGTDGGLRSIQLRLSASRFGALSMISGWFALLPGAGKTEAALGWMFLFCASLFALAVWAWFLARVGALRAASEGGTRMALMLAGQSQNLQRMRILPGAVGKLARLEDNLGVLTGFLAQEISGLYGLPMVCAGLFLAGLLAGAWSFLGLFGLALLVLAARLGWDILGNETIEKSRSTISSMADLLRGTLLPVRMTHSLGIEGAQLARAEHWVDRLGAARRRTAWVVCVYAATEALSILLIVGSGVVLGWFALRGSGIGMLLALGAGFCAAGIQFAAMELARLARRSEGVSHLAAELFEFLDERDPPMRPGTRALGPILDSLELDDVCLRDEDSGKRLLAGVTMAIPAGKRIALVSEDPETAHALFAVLARLVEPGSGDIRMDRVNLRSAREDDLRSQVAMVCPADGMLPGTVISNLVAGREIAETIAIDAAKRVHLDRIVRELPDGYQTIVDGSGNPLTPFAKHLLALARAIPGNPSLILWEDPDFPLTPSEAALLDDACRRWFAGKTVLMLARRSATLRHSDKVFFLRGPSLEGFGTHTELMETSPGYRHVVARILVETDRK